MATAAQGETKRLAAFWQAFSHPIRLKVLDILRAEGVLNVGELVERIGIGQGHLSNHLGCLRALGVVEAQSRGRYVHYRIADPRIVQLLDLGAAVVRDHRNWGGPRGAAVDGRPGIASLLLVGAGRRS
ncbi:MAG: metalloregulator ArsR/SmtB family transcription factor [Firmicutes bacterium]|nr:helix-turn-helix transcriptional regulator [Alicyclobacillaceae bacterium]MCL6496216.1 metalloregulator ArsR/SmtB family transcription factor [Bacillota bacterium]